MACATTLGDLDLPESNSDRHDEGSFWTDLRPSERDRLRTLLYEAEQRALRSCEELVVEAYAAAIATFEAEFPNAPRRAAAAIVPRGNKGQE